MKLPDIKRIFRKYPPKAANTMEKEKIMELKVGQLAPDFSLPSHLDKKVTLSDLRGKNVVLAFFPQAWTPI